MAWKLFHNPDIDVIEFSFTGETSRKDLIDLTIEGVTLSKEVNVPRFLVDLTKIELTATLTDLYNLPTNEYEHANMNSTTRIALIQPDSDRELEATKFYEEACRESGWNARRFGDREEALEWLSSESK